MNNNQLSFMLAVRPGDLFNLGSNRTLNGDAIVPASLQRPLFVGRNSIRGPGIRFRF